MSGGCQRIGRPVRLGCLSWLPRHGPWSRPTVPLGIGTQDTSAPFLAPFARAQEIGRDPRETPVLGAGQVLSS